jgi:hypothetical protein
LLDGHVLASVDGGGYGWQGVAGGCPPGGYPLRKSPVISYMVKIAKGKIVI